MSNVKLGYACINMDNTENMVHIDKYLLIYALRYSIGQTTSAPIQVMDALRNNIDAFTEIEIEIFINEIKSKRKKKSLGTNFDKINWNNFQVELESILRQRIRERELKNQLQKMEG